MIRWPLVAAVALLMILATACGDDSDDPAGTATGGASTPSSSPMPEPTTAATEPAQDDRPRLGTPSGVETTARDPAFEARPGATAYYGSLGNAVYQVEVPGEWNGSLVLWAHGFRGFGTGVTVSPPSSALRDVLLADGYAWAASSFSENGYAPGIGADDTLALRDWFVKEFGEPEYTYIVGASMGGNVVTLALEHHGAFYDGGLAVCGALGGQEQVDYLISWALVAEFVSGVELPIGGGAGAMAQTLLRDMSPALGSPDVPTIAGEQFISIVREMTGGPRPFFLEGVAEHYLTNFGLILADPNRELVATRAGTNVEVVYAIGEGMGMTAEEINAGIQRFEADPEARNAARHPDAVPTTARISAPLLTLHGTGDLFVPITHQVRYFEKAQEAGTTDMLVQRIIRTPEHCSFSDEELVKAWNDLRAWVEEGIRPESDDVTGDLTNAGLRFTNPLRPGDPGGR